MLSGYLAEIKKYDELEKLLTKYPDDFGLHWVYAYPLLKFVKEGDTPKSKKLLLEAIERNKFVVDYLIGKKKMPKYVPDSYAVDSDDEAVCYVADFKKAWENIAGAIDWIKRANDPNNRLTPE
ncbi:hypothetical protein COT42_00445 [Candidatus Saganbacteria bacterium CG08_land_8_20_14_0_20_45_16]|uniref:Uncharacterized protein n=1 Tax=Candidatus Saganbacteria bacterium CG08_land_8_20_14_0_20_45_16 TaxID=2014293 RepID=A0A2H0Y2F5_UNCSA|nr:MAG: hypothetical protein COT42_00445 [Candidatus Saganbacteria bacterium CG08_land_8_20_14_0_20_45_16]